MIAERRVGFSAMISPTFLSKKMNNYYFILINHLDGDIDQVYIHEDKLEKELERLKEIFPDSKFEVIPEFKITINNYENEK